MMALSTLWKVDSTIGPDRNSLVAEQILRRWDHDPRSARFVRSSANFLYVFRHERQPYFLRFAASTERRRDGIEAEMDLLGWLTREGVTVTPPVPSRQGEMVETVETDWGIFYAVVFPALRGVHREIEALDVAQFHSWGAALGMLHAAMKRYPGRAQSVRETWEDQLDVARASLTRHKMIVRNEGEELHSSFQTLATDREVFGLIHADFELDNLVWLDHTVGILDFDDCMHAWYVADIALALRDLFAEHVDLEHLSFQAFIRGYAAHHPLQREMLTHIPMCLRFARFVTYARLARALDLPADRAYPAWLTALQQKLASWMAAYEESLERRAAESMADG